MLFKQLKQIYTSPNSNFVYQYQDNEISNYMLLKWLSMNPKLISITNYLNRFCFKLTPKQFLALCWSVVPKVQQMPYIKYIKKEKEELKYKEITEKIIKEFQISETDFEFCKKYIYADIEKKIKDKSIIDYLTKYAIEKRYWKNYGIKYLDFKKNEIKNLKQLEKTKKEEKKKNGGLGKWF